MHKIIKTDKAAQAIGPYSQAVEVNGFMYLSGQIPLGLDGQVVSTDFTKQAHQIFANAKAILKANDLTLKDVFKSLIFLKDINDFAVLNKIYEQYFTENFPARSCVEVSRLPKDVLLEIELIACKN